MSASITAIVAGITTAMQGIKTIHCKVCHAISAVFRGNLERRNYPGFEKPKGATDEKKPATAGNDNYPCGEC
jgi:hypothetical protein